jgi:uncharacterized protein (TIGR03435 family)
MLAAMAALAQNPAAPDSLEIATIRATTPGPGEQINVGVHIDDDAMLNIHALSLKEYIALAYRVKDFQIAGPDWLADRKFDVNAKLPVDAHGVPPPGIVEALLQGLLANRFKLDAHIEKKEFPIYALLVSKNGPALKESPRDPVGASGPDKAKIHVEVTGSLAMIDLGQGAYITNHDGRVVAHQATIAALIETLARFVDRTIVDMTGLTGTYDLSLAYGVEDLRHMLRALRYDRPIPDNALPPGSILESLKAAGLILEAREVPFDAVVVDHIEKTPEQFR